MILFDLIFGNDIPHTGGLFYKGGGAYDKYGGRLIIARGGEVNFGTYFNLYPYCTYRTYCGIQKVQLILNGSGSYTVKTCLITKANTVSILSTAKADGNFVGVTDVSSLPEDGYLFFTVYSEDGCELYSGSWNAEKEQERDVNIGIVICTYNREKFVKANLSRLTEGIEKEPEWADRLHAFVVDNAKSINLEKNPYYTVINNKNLGGSGGFTRGICEVYDSGCYTHFLLMDDDIQFDFEIIKRTWRIAALLSPEYCNKTIGGAMLVLENPCLQHEFGGQFNGLKQISLNSKLDMRRPENLIKNLTAPKPDYNAWWYCCMPVSYVQKYGLPLCFFIKCDDIEYGIRCGSDIILTNGIAIWHSDLAGKYNVALEYYVKRNEAVVCAIHGKKSRFSAAMKFLYYSHIQLILKDYDCAENILNAYRDFMKGSRFLLETDPEELNKKIMQHKPEMLSFGEIEELCGINPENIHYNKPLKSNFLKKAILFIENYMPKAFFKDTAGAADICDLIPSRAYLKKTVIRYSSLEKTGYICRLDTKRRRKIRRQIYRVFFSLIFRYGKYKKDYRSNAKVLSSRENWDKMFGN